MPQCDRFVFWGSAGHAKVIADIVTLSGGSVIALFDNNPDAHSCLDKVPLFLGTSGFSEWLNEQKSLQGIGAALAIGGHRGSERQHIAQQLLDAGLSLPTLIHPSAVISESASLGDGCQILANCVVAADVSMNAFCILNNSANVDHECVFGCGVHIAPGAVLCGCVTVADNSFIGAGAVILPRVMIGSNVLVGAGAVVTRNIPDDVVVFGNPAKIIKPNTPQHRDDV